MDIQCQKQANNQPAESLEAIQNKECQSQSNRLKGQQSVGPGQTIFNSIYSIDCGYLIGFYKQRNPTSTVTTAVLLNVNGSPVTISKTVANIIIKHMNNIMGSDPYCYYSLKGTILMNFKIVGQGVELSPYFEEKVKEINGFLPALLGLYGIERQIQSKGNGRKIACDRMEALIACLQMKKKVTGIVKQHTARKKQLKQQRNKEGDKSRVPVYLQPINQQVSESKSPETGAVYQYFSSVAENQTGKDINKSQKFSITKSRYTLTIEDEGSQKTLKNIQLIKKHPKQTVQTQKKTKQKAMRKLAREINIIKQIKDSPEYFLKYYIKKPSPQEGPVRLISTYGDSQKMELFMEYAPSNLAFVLTNQIFGLREMLVRFREIVEGVAVLHRSGIVHRDLKPENIMVYDVLGQENALPKIKIIDFSDSALMNEKCTTELSNSLGSSLPYSPFECSYNCQFGLKSPQIDLWSLGMLLHELTYKTLPSLYYQNPSLQEFLQGIEHNKLSIKLTPLMPNRRGYFGFLEEAIQRVIENCLVLVHYQRMGVQLIGRAVDEVLGFMGEMESIVQGSGVY